MHEYLVDVTMCVGPSMLPTFNSAGDVVVMERISAHLRTIKPGEIVVARSPTNARQTVCKRVRAVAGEEVKVPGAFWQPEKRLRIPQGHIWLQGDNPNNSTDSRHYGPVPLALVKGRVFFKLWPAWEMGSTPPKIDAESLRHREPK